MKIKLSGLLALLLMSILACTSTTVELPLADDRPTLLFFYTDG
ncbi:MAG: hypothetical protein AAF846_09270 [Chloroflexota bacterium]